MRNNKPRKSILSQRGLFVREPILPVDVLIELFELNNISPSNIFSQRLRPKMRELFYEALTIAAPTLASQLQRGGDSNTESSPKEWDKLDHSLLKYIIRASTRATPFGLFASVRWIVARDECSLPTPASLSKPIPKEKESFLGNKGRSDKKMRKYYWPSRSLIFRWVRELERDPWVDGDFELYANPALLLAGNRLKVTYRDGYGQGGEPGTAWMRITPVTKYILDICKEPILMNKLIEMLQQRFIEGSRNQIKTYLIKLLDEGVLLSTLRPPVAADPDYSKFNETLRRLESKSEYAKYVIKLLEYLKSLNTKPINQKTSLVYKFLQESGYTQGTQQNLLQASLILDEPSTYVSVQKIRALQESFVDAAVLLCKLFTADRNLPHIVAYARAFREKYGMREVPLLELLDDDIGLGPPPTYREPPSFYARFASPFAGHPGDNKGPFLRIAELVFQCIRNGSREILLSADMSDDKFTNMPDTADVVFNLWNLEGQADPYAVLSPVGFVYDAGSVMSRFRSHLFQHCDSQIAENDKERDLGRQDGSIVATVDYLHKVGHYTDLNWQEDEDAKIFMSTSGAGYGGAKIALEDIRVGLDGDAFYMVAPTAEGRALLYVRNRSMFNLALAPNVVRFMIEVSSFRNTHIPAWDWGPLSHLPFLPRVRYNNIVLSLARWKIPEAALSAREQFIDWRQQNDIPRFAFIGKYDHRLLLDLESPRAYDLIVKEKAEVLMEAPDPYSQRNTSRVIGANTEMHPFAEYVLNLSFSANPSLAATSMPRRAGSQYGRSVTPREKGMRTGEASYKMHPGEMPVYMKIYAPDIYHNDIAYHIQEAAPTDKGYKWFFVRYQDPDPHIRIRLYASVPYCQALTNLVDIIRRISADTAIIHWSIATYFPETERYGGSKGIEIAEELFINDTQYVLRLFEEKYPISNIHLGFASVDIYLKALGFDLHSRAKIYSASIQNTVKPGVLKERRKYFWKTRDEYLSWYRQIAMAMQQKDELLKILINIRRLGHRYRELGKQDKLLFPFSHIALSLIHMHANRLGLSHDEEMDTLILLEAAYRGFTHHLPDDLKGLL